MTMTESKVPVVVDNEATQANMQDYQVTISQAPMILDNSTTRVTNALAMGKELLTRVEAEGMTAELDAEVEGYLKKCKATLKHIKETREPITKGLDAIKKLFTSLEQKLDPDRQDNIYHQLKVKRDEFAQHILEQKQKQEQERQLKLQKDREVNRIHHEVRMDYQAAQSKLTSSKLSELHSLVEKVTLENHLDITAEVHAFATDLPIQEPSLDHITSTLLSADEVQAEKSYSSTSSDDVVKDNAAAQSERKQQLEDLKLELLEKIPAKVRHLQQLENERIAREKAAAEAREAAIKAEAEAKAAQDKAAAEAALKAAKEAELKATQEKEAAEARQREMEAQMKAREEEDRQKAEAAAKAAEAARQEQAATDKELKDTATLFDSTASAAEGAQVPKGTKQITEIEVLGAAGWMKLVNFYFQEEGMQETDMQKIGKKTLNAMKKLAEKKHDDEGIKVDSPALKYVMKAKTKLSRSS